MKNVIFHTASYKELVKKLDRVFSVYIRLKESDGKGFCTCITCGKMHHYKGIHNGHFIPRDRKATRFNEMNCHPQCVYCNYHKHGQPDIYRSRLIEMYGKEEVEKLERLAQMGGADDSISLQQKIKEYKEKVKALKKGKDLEGDKE
jgi:hypothetical protein